MTDDTRVVLRRGLEMVVRAAMGRGRAEVSSGGSHRDAVTDQPRAEWTQVYVRRYLPGGVPVDPPPLTPFQQMCLSGLLGDPAQLEAAVVDHLLDSGAEYATACYEKGKRDAETERKADEERRMKERWNFSVAGHFTPLVNPTG